MSGFHRNGSNDDFDYSSSYDEFDQRNAQPPEKPPIEIPSEALSSAALAGVIDNFILREGTDYGTAEVTHDTKVQQVHRQLEKQQVRIIFDPNTETVTLMTERDWKKLRAQR